LQDREGLSEADVLEALDRTPPDELLEPADAAGHGDDALWEVVFEASRVDEVHLRAGADLQRVLPSVSDPERRTDGPEALAGGGRVLRAHAADPGAGPAGHRRSEPDVAYG